MHSTTRGAESSCGGVSIRTTISAPNAHQHGLTATDLFAGGGGSSEGLRQAGYRIVVCANHWDLAVETHALNHPEAIHLTANLRETNFRAFPRTHILWASPSCARHTVAARLKPLSIEDEMRAEDPAAVDRATANAVIEATEVHQYEAVIVENVPEFRRWVLYRWWLAGMATLGYQAQEVILNAADFGLPQNRRRLFIVFTRDGSVDLTPPAIAPVHAATILDPELGLGDPVTRRLYVTPQIESITERDVTHLVTYRRNARARRADTHPLATVTAGGNHHAIATITTNGPLHRLLTHRECARAQGFPDTYRFAGPPGSGAVKKMIGNAVPVAVARFLGGRVAQHLGYLDAAAVA
jgi:DNA (cytosine-5)-methyltransferase 1